MSCLARRVYTRRLWSATLLALIVSLGGVPARAQVNLSVDPAMTKGPPNAPVVMIEFSDYQ